jgi:hypothetical protein
VRNNSIHDRVIVEVKSCLHVRDKIFIFATYSEIFILPFLFVASAICVLTTLALECDAYFYSSKVHTSLGVGQLATCTMTSQVMEVRRKSSTCCSMVHHWTYSKFTSWVTSAFSPVALTSIFLSGTTLEPSR